MDRDEIFALVVRSVREVLPELHDHTFRHDDELTRLGANSVDRAEIINITLESLSLRVARLELSGVKNIGSLVDFLYAKTSSSCIP